MNINESDIAETIADIKLGKMVIIMDREDRENEADLYIPAEKATPEIINTMLAKARGILCVALLPETLTRLSIPLMVPETENTEKTGLRLCISVNAKHGVTTGVSAHDRTQTIKKLIDPKSLPEDFTKPGHIFPLCADSMGLWGRDGHTEAAVTLAHLAGFASAGVLCEILQPDGRMATLSDLKTLVDELGIKIITIKKLSEYIKSNNYHLPVGNYSSVRRVSKSTLETRFGPLCVYVYHSGLDDKEHVALVAGDIENKPEVLARIHSKCLTGDTFFSRRCDCGEQLHAALGKIQKRGQGVLLYLDQEGRGIGLSNKIKAYHLQDAGYDTVEANIKLGFPADIRDYKIAADILKDLKISSIVLLTNNPKKVDSLTRYGAIIDRSESLEIPANKINRKYLQTKKNKLGHTLKNI